MAKVRIKMDKAGIRQLLHESGIESELMRLGRQMADAAGAAFEARAWSRPTKAVVNVVDPRPGAMRKESKSGALARAVSGMKR
jgi:hypothetical protein